MTDGEPARLIDLWAGAGLAIVVDAVRSDPPDPGRVHEFGAALDAGAAGSVRFPARPVTDHALGLGGAVALGLAVDRMPGRLRVLAIEGLDFGFGRDLTPRVAAAVDAVADRIAASPALPARRPPVEEQMLIAPAPSAAGPSRPRTGERPS
ncbi:hydrogenase maturation protease [Actinomadura sediminis]|uniref:Hydrogenase maturation protease n=1 Tax=Actinomadura sediminis TaxID=1038904 RepID=A0ABW3EG05_9ACTN